MSVDPIADFIRHGSPASSVPSDPGLFDAFARYCQSVPKMNHRLDLDGMGLLASTRCDEPLHPTNAVVLDRPNNGKRVAAGSVECDRHVGNAEGKGLYCHERVFVRSSERRFVLHVSSLLIKIKGSIVAFARMIGKVLSS